MLRMPRAPLFLYVIRSFITHVAKNLLRLMPKLLSC